MSMHEMERFNFVKARDGEEAAVRFLRENVIATYRKCVLDPRKYTLYRRAMIESYCEAKRILRGISG
jgi:hypothetical protein